MELAPLYEWFRASKRDLPWRRRRDPYAIWLSEVMAQQTTIKAVIPYYERFLTRFPDVASLAAADLDSVLELWAGLGYYRRARHLHAAARQVHELGAFPASSVALRELSGVGEYTAAAIASIAYGECVPVIDGNVERVLCRFFGLDGNPKRGATRKSLRAKAKSLIVGTDPGEHNQALMELGALICRPKSPQCQSCPMAAECVALRDDRVAELPALAKRPKVRARLDRAAVVVRNGKILYCERHADEVWGGLWELPRVVIGADESVQDSLARLGQELLGVELQGDVAITSHRHGVMNERIRLEVYATTMRGEPSPKSHHQLAWLGAKEAAAKALPSPQKKVLKAVFAWLKSGHLKAAVSP